MKERETMDKKEIVKRWRKVRTKSERLYWRHSSPGLQHFDFRDKAIIRNGVLTTHFYTLKALIEEIADRERDEMDCVNDV